MKMQLRFKLSTSVLAMAAALFGCAAQAVTQSWSVGNGTWDTVTGNWTDGSTWTNGNEAIFNNTAAATTVTLGEAITAAAVKIGDGGNNANYAFSGSSLVANSLTLQGYGGNDLTTNPTATFNDLALTLSGDLGVGRAYLNISGNSIIVADRIGGGGMTGITSADWGQVTLSGNANVTVNNGIVGGTTAWGLNLNGGTLTTKGIDYGPHNYMGTANLVFNGTLVKANATNANFITVSGGLDGAGPTAPDIAAGGAKIDTDGYDIGISVPLAGSGTLTKLGAGTLTLSGANSYSGQTVITNGMLVASNNVALGVGGWNGGTMTWIRDGATLALAGGVSLDEHMHVLGSGVDGKGALRSLSGDNALPLKYNGGISGPGFCFDGDTTVGVDDGTLTVTGFYQYGGAYSMTKVGAGTLVVSQDSTYTGTTTISNGTLVAANNAALGAGGMNAATMSYIRDGATLALQGGVSLSEHFHFWGGGVGGLGAVRSLSGNNSLTVDYCLRSDVVVGVDADTLTVNKFYQEDGTFGLTKKGGGTLTVATFSYAGNTIVSNGTLRLGAASLADASTVSVASGAMIDLAFSGLDIVGSLVLDGAAMPGGRYTAASHPAFISGSGTLVVPGLEYTWNTGNGIWDTTTPNWTGAGTIWSNDNVATFANRAEGTTVTLGEPILAGSVKVGNGGNNANYTFTGGSLSSASIAMQGYGGNGSPAGATARFIDMLVDAGIDIGVGRMGLVISSGATVTAGRIGGAGITGIASADWGQLTIQDGAVVTAAGGIFGNTTAWGVNLDGGTLTTKGIDYGPHSYAGGTVNLKFNGTLVKASETNLNFITVTGGLDSGYNPEILAGGARLDSNGFDLGIGVGLQGSGALTKLGAGTLTLSGANSYEGGTIISNGTVNASYRANAGGDSALGKAVPASVVTIDNGGVLTGSGDNWLDNTAVASDAANAHTVVINAGGLLKGKNGATTGLGNVTLAGGTIEVSNGLGAHNWNASFTLGGDIIVSGTVPSAITTAAGSVWTACIYMADGSNGTGGTNTFTVNDVTGTPSADLAVGARLAKGTVIKAGAGTLALVAGATGTETPVNWQVAGGTLQVGALGAMPSCDVEVNVDGAFEPGSGEVTLNALSGSGTLRVSTDSALTVASVPSEATLKIAIADPQNLDAKQQYTVLTATDTLAGTPTSSSLPPRWVVFKDGNTWKIKAMGTMIIIF